MAKFEKRLEARSLRKKGWSIRSIALHLRVSKASASVWCRDLQLTPAQKKRLLLNAIKAGHAGRLKGALMNKKKKQERIWFYRRLAEQELTLLTNREFLIAGAALYWGEGNKNSRLGFINSDPQMIKFMHRWFRRALGVKREEFMPRIFINAIHRPRIRKILKFWSQLLRLPVRQFGNTTFIKRNPKKIYENYDSYYGLLSIGTRNSSELKYRILGLIKALAVQGIYFPLYEGNGNLRQGSSVVEHRPHKAVAVSPILTPAIRR